MHFFPKKSSLLTVLSCLVSSCEIQLLKGSDKNGALILILIYMYYIKIIESGEFGKYYWNPFELGMRSDVSE